MKNFVLKVLRFLLNFIIVIGAVVSVGNLVLQFLPADVSQPVLDWLNTSLDTILPCGIATTITTVVLAIAKYSNTALQVTLKNSERKQELQRKQLEESYNERIALAEERDLAIIDLINENTRLIRTIIKQNGIITDYEKIVAAKNIASTIIPDELKDKFRAWLSEYKEKTQDIEPIKIEVVEVKDPVVVEEFGVEEERELL